MRLGLLFCLIAIFLPKISNAGELKSINFFQKSNVSFFEFEFNKSEVEAEKFSNKEDKQIIIDFENVEAADRTLRGFDASEFEGAIVYMSAYKKNDSAKDIRVNIQLRDNVRSVLEKEGAKYTLKVENRFGAFSELEARSTKAIVETKAQTKDQIEKINVPKSSSISDILENLTLSGKKKYIGKKISLDVRDVKVEEVLKMISDASGFNIIITEEVKSLPSLTLNLVNIAWDQALDTVLNLNKLVAKKMG